MQISGYTVSEARTAFAALLRRARKRTLTPGEKQALTRLGLRLRQLKKRSNPAHDPDRKPPAYIKRFSNRLEVFTYVDGRLVPLTEFPPDEMNSAHAWAKRNGYVPISVNWGPADNRGRGSRGPARNPRRRPARAARGAIVHSSASLKRRGAVRIGKVTEIRYVRDVGRKPGFYRHTFTDKHASVWTMPDGSIVIR